MKIQIKATNLDLTQSLTNYIFDKIGPLEKFLSRLDEKGVATAWVEVGRTTKHHKQGDVFRAECNLKLPGKLIRAEHEEWDVRRCIDEIKYELHRQIKKYNERIRVQDSRGKELIRKFKGK